MGFSKGLFYIGYTGEWYLGYIDLLHLRARWYAPESGTFLSVDPVESEPPYQYVRGNPVNLVDPSGFAPNCEPDKPCKVIVGAKLLGATYSKTPTDRGLWHSFLLVVDPNLIYHHGISEFSLNPSGGGSSTTVFADSVAGAEDLSKHIDEPSAIYYFRGGPSGWIYWDPLAAFYGHYKPLNPDGGTENLDYLPIGAEYKAIADNVDCPSILKCFKDTMDYINQTELTYIAAGRNSNTVVSSVLRRCGLRAVSPFPSLNLPQWDEDIDDDSWTWNRDEDHSNPDWPNSYIPVPPRTFPWTPF